MALRLKTIESTQISTLLQLVPLRSSYGLFHKTGPGPLLSTFLLGTNKRPI